MSRPSRNAGRVVPRAGRDGLGGQVDAGQQAGGQAGRELAAVGVDVDQDQAGGARGDAGHRGGLALPPGGDPGGVGGGGADAVAPAAGGQAGAGVGQVAGVAVLGAAGGAVAEGPFAGRRQRQDVPAERGQVEREPGRVADGGHGRTPRVSRRGGGMPTGHPPPDRS